MRVTNTMTIDATPDVVWRVTLDVERWPDWTPTVTSVRRLDGGDLRVGSSVLIRQPLQPESLWVVTVLEPGRRFAWETRRTGLRMTGSHEIEAVPGGTRNVLAVEADGWLARLLWPLLKPAMVKSLADENLGLRTHCEAMMAKR